VPDELAIVAIVESLVVHEPPEVASVKMMDCPLQTLVAPAIPEKLFTFRVAVEKQPELKV
jgi:hypothetical protein